MDLKVTFESADLRLSSSLFSFAWNSFLNGKIFLVQFPSLEKRVSRISNTKKRAASDTEIDGVLRINNFWEKKGLVQKKQKEMKDNSLKNS